MMVLRVAALVGSVHAAVAQMTDCSGQANGAVCDDSNPDSAVSICHAGVCETTTFVQQPNSQCANFIEPFDTSLVTLELAEAACASNPACGGVSDLYCNGMFPGAVDHYALCDGDDLIADASTCVFQAPGSGLAPVVVDCLGAADETPCDDGDNTTPIDICHAGVCEATSYTKTPMSQCANFLAHDTSLITLALAEAACEAAPNCAGISDLYCNGMFPGAVDHYALCDDTGLVDDALTCVYVDTSGSGCAEDLDSDGLVNVNDLLAILSAFGSDGTGGGDVDGNGTVDVNDLLQLLSAFGSECSGGGGEGAMATPCAYGDDCGGQEHTGCGTMCPLTCGELPSQFCNEMCYNGYQCANDLFWDEDANGEGSGACVAQADCSIPMPELPPGIAPGRPFLTANVTPTFSNAIEQAVSDWVGMVGPDGKHNHDGRPGGDYGQEEEF